MHTGWVQWLVAKQFMFFQISYAASSTDLSDKQRFPSFFRTLSSDFHQVIFVLVIYLSSVIIFWLEYLLFLGFTAADIYSNAM